MAAAALQAFQVKAGVDYNWSMKRGGKTLQSGSVRTDKLGLLTIPDVEITSDPSVLVIE